MIVKNESLVIEDCLNSVKPLIDYWVIVDTGSTDNTKELIKKTMRGIPGILYEKPWVNFGHNRNEALQLAKNKGDYLLFIDADEVLVPNSTFTIQDFANDIYFVQIYQDNIHYFPRATFVNNHLDWKWRGVIHEELYCNNHETYKTLKEIINVPNTKKGYRSQDPDKYLNDALLLEKVIQEDPSPRNYYYLAQSYAGANKMELALLNYEKRAKMGGNTQEVAWSYYSAGILQEVLDYPKEAIIQNFSKAYELMPHRAEPLIRLSYTYFSNENYALSYALSSLGLTIPFPNNDLMHVNPSVYNYELLYIHSGCAFFLKKYDEAIAGYQKVLERSDLPLAIKEDTEKNLQITLNAKNQIHQSNP